MPPDEKSQKRVQKLFSELERISTLREPSESEGGAEKGEARPVAGSEMEELLLRIRELESQIREKETRPVPAAAPQAPSVIYEKEEVGYAFLGDEALPLKTLRLPAENLAKTIETLLTAGGETIGTVRVQPSAERAWSDDEAKMTNAVAQ